MARRSEAAEHSAELLAPLGTVRVGRMFGGWGFHVDEVFIALAAAERLYLNRNRAPRGFKRAAATSAAPTPPAATRPAQPQPHAPMKAKR